MTVAHLVTAFSKSVRLSASLSNTPLVRLSLASDVTSLIRRAVEPRQETRVVHMAQGAHAADVIPEGGRTPCSLKHAAS